jgi:putative transposase
MTAPKQDGEHQGDERQVRIGRPPTLNAQHRELLRALATEQPQATSDELTQQLRERTGVSVCSATVRKALRQAGIVKVKAPQLRAPASDRPKRYGYQSLHRRQAPTGRFSTDLTDAEWQLVRDLFEREGGRGTPAQYARRELLDACCYVLRTGCAWRLLPDSFPPWTAVYKAFSRWVDNGTFEAMQDRLREQWRERIGRNAKPSAAVIDAQSTRGSPQGGELGYDAGKKVKGRKRHLVVDTLGLLLAVLVTSASVQDRDAAATVVGHALAKAETVTTIFADSAYAKSCAQVLHTQHGVNVQIVRRPGNGSSGTYRDQQQPLWQEPLPSGFVPLPKRWVVERTHAWGERWRRLVMHHDRNTTTAAGWVWLAEARILAARLA